MVYVLGEIMEQQPPTLPQSQPRAHSKLIQRALIGLGVVMLSAALTVTLIKIFYKPPVAKTTNVATVKELSPTELIKKYSDGYKLDNYTIDTVTANSILSYKLSDTSYTVQISSRDNVKFARADNSVASDITSAIDKSKAFLTSNGFSKASGQLATDESQALYDSPANVCLISSSMSPDKKASAYGLVCADKKAFAAERDAIKTLAEMYKNTGGSIDFKSVVRTTHTEGNKSLSLLSINPQNTSKAPYTLIFASIDDKWSYVGSRVTPSIDVAESFQIPSTLKTAINDPKYGGFLAKYVY